jgi:hypothetical protein
MFGSAFRPPDYERNHPMRNFLGTVLPLLCLLNTAHARADETAAKSRIVAVGLSLREEGVYSVNKRNELLWTMTLKPGEERR